MRVKQHLRMHVGLSERQSRLERQSWPESIPADPSFVAPGGDKGKVSAAANAPAARPRRAAAHPRHPSRVQFWVAHVRETARGQSGRKVYRCSWVGFEHEPRADFWHTADALERRWGVSFKDLDAQAAGLETGMIVPGI